MRQDLALAAYNKTAISNSIDEAPSQGQIALVRMTHRMVITAATRLGPPTGRYNCHGLVFASRRTNIPARGEDLRVADLLRWDGYTLVTDRPQVGDVAAYVDPTGDIEHTGIVCSVDDVGNTPVVHVWSMWGGLGEFRHRADSTPYSAKITYWRLR